MRINGSSFDPLRPDRVTPGGQPSEHRPDRPATGSPPPPPPLRNTSDSVQISDAGRSLAKMEKRQPDPFDAERIAELRTKVLSGAYNSLDVVDQVARQILSRGEL